MFKLRSTKNVFITDFNENDGTFKAVTNQEGPWSVEYQRIEGGRAVNKQLSGYARSNANCDMRVGLYDVQGDFDCKFVGYVKECPGRKAKMLKIYKPGEQIVIYPGRDLVSACPASGNVSGLNNFSFKGCMGDEQFSDINDWPLHDINPKKCLAVPSLILPNYKLGNSNELYPVVSVANPNDLDKLAFYGNNIPVQHTDSITLVVNEIPEGLDPGLLEFKIQFDYTCTGGEKTCGIDYRFAIDISVEEESDFRFYCAETDEGNDEGPVDTPLGNYDNPPTFYRGPYRRFAYTFNEDIYVGTEKALAEATLPPGATTISLEQLIVHKDEYYGGEAASCLQKLGDCDDLVFVGLWATEFMLRRSYYKDYPQNDFTWSDDWWVRGFHPFVPAANFNANWSKIPDEYEHGLRENATKTAMASGGYAEMIDIIPSLNASSILKINPYLGPIDLIVGLQCINSDKTELLGTAKLAEIKVFPPPYIGVSNFIGKTDEFLPPIHKEVTPTYTHTFPPIPKCSDLDPSIGTKVAFETYWCEIVDFDYDTNTVTVDFTDTQFEFSIHQHCLCEVPMDPSVPSKTVYSPLGGPNVRRWPGSTESVATHQNVYGIIYSEPNGTLTGGTTENMRVTEFSPNESITVGPDMTICSGSRVLSIVPGTEKNVVVESVNNTNKTITFKPLAQTFYFIYSVSCGGVETKRYVVYGNNKMPIEVEYNPPI